MSKKNFLDRLKIEDPQIYSEMLEYLETHGVEGTARKYAHILREDPTKLFYKLRMYVYRKKKGILPNGQKAEAELTVEEKELLERFRTGEADFEHVQREVAVRVLERILKDPALVKTSDWLKSEMVKIKREETAIKKGILEMAWTRLFGGFLPPKECPKCGHNLEPKKSSQPLEFEEAEALIDDTKSLGNPTGL